jgi:hypothetical protein
MKKFKDAPVEDDSNDSLITIIANSLNRASSGNKDDTRALGLLNLSKDGLPASVARKLASTSNRK